MAAITSRYARAFADVVLDKKLDSAATVQQLRDIVVLAEQNADLRKVWENPAVPADQKRKLLDAITARLGSSRSVRNFVAVLIDHHRINALAIIARQFETELNTRLGLAEASVTSSRELNSSERHALEAQLETVVGKKVRAHYGIDQELLGGAVVRVGSTVYDGSVRGQLEKIREQLSAE